MQLYERQVLGIDISVAYEMDEAVDAGSQQVLRIFQRRCSAQMRQNLHAIGVCLGDDRFVDARLEFRNCAFSVVHPDLDETHASRVELAHVCTPFLFGSRAPRDSQARLARRSSDWCGSNTLPYRQKT